MFIGNNAIKWHFVFCHCISVSLNKFCIQPSFLMILCTLKAKKYFQTININDSVSWVKYAVWSDRSTYCYLEIYELWAFISGRQFLATKTKVKVKWKSDMDNYLNISSSIAFEDSTLPLPKPIKIFCLNSSSTSLTMERQVANPVEGTWQGGLTPNGKNHLKFPFWLFAPLPYHYLIFWKIHNIFNRF